MAIVNFCFNKHLVKINNYAVRTLIQHNMLLYYTSECIQFKDVTENIILFYGNREVTRDQQCIFNDCFTLLFVSDLYYLTPSS